MSWGKQVHRDLVRQQDTSNNIVVGMNGTNGNCSCHKQSHCNRLTCYRRHTRSGSITQLKLLPLVITMLVLALAMPMIDAAVIKRSLAETNTIASTPTIDETNANTPPAGVGEIDFTTVNTPLLANKQTADNSNESGSSDPTVAPSEMHISVEPETTTGSSTTITVNTTNAESSTANFSLHVPQNVSNDIPKTLNEGYEGQRNIKQIFIESKFDNADAVLVEGLGNTLPDSIRNEIDGELEANAIPADEALSQVVSDQAEDGLTQHESSTKLAEKVADVLTEVTSANYFTEPHQSVFETTERSTIAQALTSNGDQSLSASKALSIFFPKPDAEPSSTTSMPVGGSEREPRNFKQINDNGNVDILNERSESDRQSMADTEMQNIEEAENGIKEEPLSAGKSMEAPKLNQNSEAALHSPETTELKEGKPKTLDLSKIYENIITRPDEEMQYDESMIILDGDESIDDEEEGESLTKNINTPQLHHTGSTESESPVANVTELTSVVSDEPSLSIVLNENLTASEPINGAVDDQSVDLLQLVETDPLLTEDVGTTVEPESVKNVHVVIKKQGVELDEALMGVTPVEVLEETTTVKVLVKKIVDENVLTTEKTLVTLGKDLSIEKEQNDDAAEEASTDLDVASEARETNEGEGIVHNKEISNEEVKLNNDNNQMDRANNTQAEQEEHGEQEEQREQEMQSQQEEQSEPQRESDREAQSQQIEPNEQEEETPEEEENTSSSIELNTQFEGKEDVLNGDKQFFTQTNNDIGNQAEKSTTTPSTLEEVIVQDEAVDDLNVLQSSTQGTVSAQEKVESKIKALQEIENNFTDEEMEKTSHSTSEEEEISKEDTQNETKAPEHSIETKAIANEEAEASVSQEEAEESSSVETAAEEDEKKEKALHSSTVKAVTEKAQEQNSVSRSSTATEHTDAQIHISLFSTTSIPNQELEHTSSSIAAATETHTTDRKEIETFEDANNNTEDPDIVPLLVGVSTGQGEVTASTKGSRSINTQTHHSMLLTQMDDAAAATLFETFPPHDVDRTMNDHLAAESKAGIGKVTSAALLSRSGVIITVCTSIACMFLLASVVAFLISFQRQHGTLDIEMQEQRCGKDNLDEEDDEVGTCTKLLDIELPKTTIVSASSEELEECL
uniref:Uncharacterized protein n=1 Tax=Ceratitis capitata TaxID=7213 RepID=W8CAN9_CERCA